MASSLFRFCFVPLVSKSTLRIRLVSSFGPRKAECKRAGRGNNQKTDVEKDRTKTVSTAIELGIQPLSSSSLQVLLHMLQTHLSPSPCMSFRSCTQKPNSHIHRVILVPFHVSPRAPFAGHRVILSGGRGTSHVTSGEGVLNLPRSFVLRDTPSAVGVAVE